MQNPVYIIDAVRTAIGKYGGVLSALRPDDMLAQTLQALLARNPSISTNNIEEVIIGAANQAGEDNRNVARMAALLAGLPHSVAGVTVNRLCASGLQSIIDAARAISCGHGDVFIAGGVESMSRAPFVLAKQPTAYGRQAELYDTTMGWRYTNPKLTAINATDTMGQTAENVAVKYRITRAAQDAFALQSQQKYALAFAEGAFTNEIIPLQAGTAKAPTTVTIDEHPRQTTLEALAKLVPAFNTNNGTVTAGNSSGINDGASALLLASELYIHLHNIKPMAKIVSMAVAGVDPSIMGMGPVPAVQKALQRARLTVSDINLWELNEAFASQSLACINELGLNVSTVNVNGGAIALGHPLGCSGSRISTTLLHAMVKHKVRYGVATMCVGVGQGVAVVYENCWV